MVDMQSWLKKLTLGAVAFGASWTGAVGYWRSTNRLPGGADLALWLVAVPVLLLLAAWGAHALYRRAHARSADAGNAAAPAAGAQTSAPASAPAAAAALAIVASAVRTPFGHTAADLRGALAASEARPTLDAELEDADGYPVLTARIAGADAEVAALRSAFAGSESQDIRFTDAQWRALAFADAVLSELSDSLTSVDTANLPLLQLHPVWTDEWTPPQRAVATGWLRSRLSAAGWPLDRIAGAPDHAGNDEAAALMEQLLNQAGEPLLAVVLACGSQLDTATVDAMAAANTLFSARQPDGQVPGEGACALLLADAASARLLAVDAETVPALRALAHATLEQSADSARQPDTQVLPTLLAQSLERARCTPAQVVLASADGGRHPGRIRELMALAGAQLPQLDPITDLARTGDALAGCAPLAWLAALAVAADAAHEHHGAALCIGNLDPFRRDLAVVAATDFTQ